MNLNNSIKRKLGILSPEELAQIQEEVDEQQRAKTVQDDLDENGLPGQSIIDLMDQKGSPKKEPDDTQDEATDDSADKTDDSQDEAQSDTSDESANQDSSTEESDESDDGDSDEESEEDPDEFFDTSDSGTGSAKVEKSTTVNRVILDDNNVQSQKGDEDMAGNGNNIADLMIRYDHQKLTASVAEFIASDGKVMDSRLFGIVESAIEKNPEIRKLIATKIPEFIREFPDGIKDYQNVVFEVARNVRVKYMLRCPENDTLYEGENQFFAKMTVENPQLAVEYGRGLRKLQDTWLRTDVEGNILPGKTLTEGEVRKIVLDLPEEVRDEACDKLHIPHMVVKPTKKPDKKPAEKK